MYEKEAFKKKFIEKNSKYKINAQLIEVKYPPVIQSGGKYSLDCFKESDSNELSSDIIICKAFVSYKDYNGQIIPTFMINSDKPQQNQYKILLAAFEQMLKSLKEGAKNNKTLGEVYKEIKDFIISRDENLKNCVSECTINNTYSIELILE